MAENYSIAKEKVEKKDTEKEIRRTFTLLYIYHLQKRA